MPPEADPAPPPQPAAKALTCPNCGGSVTLRAAGYSVTIACQYCGSILDVTNPQVQLVTKYNKAVAELEIPLGTRGTLRGVEWEAIGYLRRSENGAYPWEEYLLFNPYHGYRWLVTDGRGWSFGEMLSGAPDHTSYAMVANGALYKPFFRDGRAQVDYVLGEFYWRVAVGERVETDDWVRPGFMLSREANDYEVSWTVSELLPPGELERAFGTERLRKPWPPLPHQPSPYNGFFKIGGLVAAGVLGLMLLLMIVFGGSSWTAAGAFAIPTDGREQTATLGPLTFNRPWQRVDVRAQVPSLENGWVDLDYTLVNRADQQAYQAYGAAERYSGRDSDGPWTEGNRYAEISIPSVPAGTYDLVVEYKGNDWNSGSSSSVSGIFSSGSQSWMSGFNHPQVQVEVRQGTLYVSNFIIAMLFILLPFLLVLFLHMKFDYARESQSDVGPTGLAALLNSEDDDD
jgi:hypothetical protein